MRSNLFLLSCLLVLGFSSCQKSIEWNDLVLTPTTPVTPTPGTTGGNLLVKMVSLSSTDTVTYIYGYDSVKRLIKLTQVGVSSGDKVDETEYYIRDAAGKLIQHTKISYSSTSALPSKYDTVYSKLHYPTGSSNFDYVIESANSGNGYVTDSVTFAYTNNRVSQYKYYATSPSRQPILVYHIDVTYDASGNVINEKLYTYNFTTTPTLSTDNAFTYDNKISPLQYGNESFVGLGENFAGPNNVVSLLITDKSGSSTNTVSVNYNIAYNSNSYPATANGTAIVTGAPAQTLQLTYFYQ